MSRVAIGLLRFVAWAYALASLFVVLLGAPGIGSVFASTALRGALFVIEAFLLLQGVAVWALLVLLAECAERYLAGHPAPGRNAPQWTYRRMDANSPPDRD